MPYKKTVHLIYYSFILITGVFACTSPTVKNEALKNEKTKTKPPSSYQDTLKITASSAIFYAPDSLQLEKIRQVTDEQVFDGSMHEYFYQQRNAHLFFQKNWPQIMIVNAKNIRYLLFLISNKQTEIIDLDKLNDPYGLIVYSVKRLPLQIDMTNVETQVNDYFK